MNILNKGQQTLILVDSGLMAELLQLAIIAKKHLKETEDAWHSPELYREMLSNHKKIMEKAIHLNEGLHQVDVN